MMKDVVGMSGHCASGNCENCHAHWETPSANVTCGCRCHKRRVMVPKK